MLSALNSTLAALESSGQPLDDSQAGSAITAVVVGGKAVKKGAASLSAGGSFAAALSGVRVADGGGVSAVASSSSTLSMLNAIAGSLAAGVGVGSTAMSEQQVRERPAIHALPMRALPLTR